jgi:hypothetical protein
MSTKGYSHEIPILLLPFSQHSNAGHFLQEDKGEELAQVIAIFIQEDT